MRAGVLARRRVTRTAVGELEAVAIDDETVAHASDPVRAEVDIDARRRATVRAQVRVGSPPWVEHRLRLTVTRETTGAGGLTLTAGSSVQLGSWRIDVRFSGFSLDPGVRGYISRPGVATFEHVSAVFGRGSDGAVRVRLAVRPGWSISGLAVSGTRGEDRAYIALGARH
jgi:hypothetical protein